MRHEGPQNTDNLACIRCNVNIGNIKCKDCVGGALHCPECVLDAHGSLPFHRLLVSLHITPVPDTYSDLYQRWTGEYFEDFTLQQLGLKIQLGHNGRPCPSPCADTVVFTVIDTSGIHDINVSFCNCVGAPHRRVQLLRTLWMPASVDRPKSAFTFDVLDTFHLLTLQGKTSAYDYYYSLTHKSDNTGLRNLKVIIYLHLSDDRCSRHISQDRYDQFLLAIRIWRHLKMLKRAGRGHDPAGVEATLAGECAVECPACPHPGRNLPAGWEDAPVAIR